LGAMITPLIAKLTRLGVQADGVLKIGMYVKEGPMPLVGRRAEVVLEPSEILSILSELMIDEKMSHAVFAMVAEVYRIEKEAEEQEGFEKIMTLDRLRIASRLMAVGAQTLK